MNEFDKLALAVAPAVSQALHEGLQDVGSYQTRLMAGGNCCGVDVGDYRFVTQNPTKSSRWASLARQGSQITWVIRRSDSRWLARVIDGQVYPL